MSLQQKRSSKHTSAIIEVRFSYKHTTGRGWNRTSFRILHLLRISVLVSLIAEQSRIGKKKAILVALRDLNFQKVPEFSPERGET